MKSHKSNRFPPEVRERAVWMVQEYRGEYPSLWACIESIAPKIGCVAQTLPEWVKPHAIDTGVRDGLNTGEREQIKALEREIKELRRANDILKLASAFFAQAELDRQLQVLMDFVDRRRAGIRGLAQLGTPAWDGNDRDLAAEARGEDRKRWIRRSRTDHP